MNATTGPNSVLGGMGSGAAGSGDGAAAPASGAAAGSGTTSTSGAAADQPSSAPLPNPWAAGGECLRLVVTALDKVSKFHTSLYSSAALAGATTRRHAGIHYSVCQGWHEAHALLSLVYCAGGAGGAGAGAGGPADLLRSLQGGGAGGLASLLGGMGGMGGMGGGAGGQAGMAEMTAQMLEDPAVREQMINMMTQPGMIDMIAASNPQLSQMINSMPMVRQTMQNPEMLRAMLNPDMLRMMSQFGGGMVSRCLLASSVHVGCVLCIRRWQSVLYSCGRACLPSLSG